MPLKWDFGSAYIFEIVFEQTKFYSNPHDELRLKSRTLDSFVQENLLQMPDVIK